MSKRSLHILIIAVAVMVGALSLFLLVLWQLNVKGNELQERIAEMTEEKRQFATLTVLDRLADESAPSREQLREYFFISEDDSENISFLEAIDLLAPRLGIVVETDLQSVVDAKDKSEWVEFSFTFSGERAGVEQFIQALEVVPYTSHLTSVSLKRVNQTLWDGHAVVQVRIMAYENE